MRTLATGAVIVLSGCAHLQTSSSGKDSSAKCSYEKLRSEFSASSEDQLLLSGLSPECPNLMADILKGESEEDVDRSMNGFIEKARPFLYSMIEGAKDKPADSAEGQRYVATMTSLGVLGKYLKSKCPAVSEKSDACFSLMAMAGFGTVLEAKVALALKSQQAAVSSEQSDAQPIVDEICAHQYRIRHLEANIKSEKQIGESSGFVNAAVLHDSTAAIMDSKQRIKELRAEYKSESGKPLAEKLKCREESELN